MSEDRPFIYVEGSYGLGNADDVFWSGIEEDKIVLHVSRRGIFKVDTIEISFQDEIKSIQIIDENEINDYLLGIRSKEWAGYVGHGFGGLIGTEAFGWAAKKIRRKMAKTTTCTQTTVRVETFDENWMIVKVHQKLMEALRREFKYLILEENGSSAKATSTHENPQASELKIESTEEVLNRLRQWHENGLISEEEAKTLRQKELGLR